MRSYEEDKVQQAIVNWLKLKGFLFTSTGAGLVKNFRTQITMNRLGYQKGCADLMVFIPNGVLHIECKRPAGLRWSNKTNKLVRSSVGGKQSDDQKLFQQKIEKIAGHKYLVASSLDDVIKFINENEIKAE